MKLKLSKILSILFISFVFFNIHEVAFAAQPTLSCGVAKYTTEKNNFSCDCDSGWVSFTHHETSYSCCGWVLPEQGEYRCFDSPDPIEVGPPLLDGITNEAFDSLNPLKTSGSPVADDLSTPGGIVSRLLNFLFPLAGLVLFALITWGGFEMLIGATDQKGLEAGKNRVTAAIVGFILLFSSYWLTQIVEMVFGISIL